MKTLNLRLSAVFILGVMAHIHQAGAQIVYTDVVPDSVFTAANGTLSLDINKDGIIDFRLTTISKSVSGCGQSRGGGGSRTNKYLYVTPADINNAVLNNANLPSAINLYTKIDSGSSLWKNTASQKMAADTFKCVSFGGFFGYGWTNGGSGNFRNTTNKCLAVRFLAGKDLYYGWIRFNVSSNATVTLKDYAYQSTAKQSILAGQTGENFIYPSGSSKSILCAGDSIKIGYVILGNFDTANVVSVELSDSLGNFSKGKVIGSLKVNISGTIPCKIPTTVTGTAFRYRITSSNPAIIAADNGINLIINKSLPDTFVTPAKTQILCNGTQVALTAPLGNGNTYQWKKDNVNISGSTARNYTANTTGLFLCDISNGCGTVKSNVVSITVLPALPAITITPAGPLTINTGDSVLLSSSSADTTFDYRWYRNNVLLNAAKSATKYMAKIAGNYTLRINDLAHGCSKTSATVSLTIQTVNAVPTAQANQTSLKIQPNPFYGTVYFSFYFPEKQQFSVRIVDLAGRVVKSIATDVSGAGQFEYQWMAADQNGNAMNAGIYFLQVEGQTFSQTEKLILLR